MKSRKVFSVFICCSFALFLCKGMQAEQALIDPKPSEEEKVKLLAEASINYSQIGDTVNAKKFLWESVKLSKELNKSRYAGCYPYMAMMTYYSKQQSLANRIRNTYIAKDSLLYAVSHTTDAEAQTASYFHIAEIEHNVFGDTEISVNFLTALALLDKIKDPRKKAIWQGRIYDNLIFLNKDWQNDKESLQYLEKLRVLAQKTHEPETLAALLMVNTTLFSNIANSDPAKKMEKDSAIFYAKKMWNLVTKQYSNERISENKYLYDNWYSYNITIASALILKPDEINMNIIKKQIAYTEDFSKKNNTYKAKTAELAVKVFYLLGMKNYAEAEKYGLELLELAKQNNDTDECINAYYFLSNIYLSTGKEEKALETEKNATNLQTQLIAEKAAQKYEDAKIKLELDQNLQEIKDLETKNHLYMAIELLSIIILGYMLFLYFKRYKHYKLQKEDMEQSLKDTNDEKEKVQKSLIATNLQMMKKNETLEKIIKKSDDKEIQKIVIADKRKDRSYEDFRILLSEISPEFYRKLQDSASSKLSNLDLKYCAYILIGLENKELMDIFSVEYKSVNMAKSRIKKKLNLGTAEKLNEFLKNLSFITPPPKNS